MLRAIIIFGALVGSSYGEESQASSKKESVMLFGGILDGKVSTNNVMVMGECSASTRDMTSGAEGPGVAVLGNQIYLCGGSFLEMCYIRDKEGTEKIGPSFNKGRRYFTLNTVGSKLVAVGGYNGGSLDSIEVLEQGSDKWKTQDYTINPARKYHCAVTISTRSVMLVGGYNSRDLSRTEELNIEKGAVTQYPDYPGTVSDHACALFQNKIISAGGFYKGSRSNKVFTLDFRTPGSAWVEGPAMKYTRISHSMVVLNGLPTVYSGEGTGEYTMEVLVHGKWAEAPLSFKRELFGAVVTPWCT